MNRQQQIITMHAAFINQVVRCILNPLDQNDLGALLEAADNNGWTELTRVIRMIEGGRRDVELLNTLDEEDQTIAEAILRGLQDPSSLPDPNAKPDPTMAAPGLASMIHAAGSGNTQALQLIAEMADQMSKVGGSMGRLAAVIRPLINGERDPDVLCKRMDDNAESMVLSILDELKQLEQAASD